jgi:PAS domain S-box-containing protein
VTPENFLNSADSSSPTRSELAQALFNTAGEGLLAVDAEGVTLLANRVARERLGVYPGQPLGEVLPELWPEVAGTLRDRQRRMELPLRIGSLNYQARISPVLSDGVLAGAVCVFEEWTKMEEMAGEMRAYQDLTRELDAIIDSSSDGLWICDQEARVMRINRASERINSITAAEVVGRPMAELVSQGFIDRSVTVEVLKTGQVVNMLQQRGERKLILTGTPVFDGTGELIRVVVSERDITEIDTLQRNLEEQAAIKDQFRHQILEMQQAALKSRRIVAKSPCMVKALRQALKVGGADSSVLILGESGVGKGLIADLIHKNSGRAEKPMIKINCGAIPESLIESELFGYEKGAFTGAQTSKPGYFEMADGGILFLDEIAELPLPSQVKLLRFLEDGRIMRLGGTQPRNVDVRVLAATHRDLEEMVEAGGFRLDLYYRLNVIPISVPAVRERRDCIPELLHYYIDHFAAKSGTRKRLTRAALDALLNYRYPGNVRELMNICERLVVMTETELIDLPDLPGHIAKQAEEGGLATGDWPETMTLQQILESVERSVLGRAAERFGNQCRMASALGVNQSTVARKLKKYGIG